MNNKKEKLYEWIGKGKINLTLKYRATENGTKIKDFYDRLETFGPTLWIARTKTHVFGGFTSIPWSLPK